MNKKILGVTLIEMIVSIVISLLMLQVLMLSIVAMNKNHRWLRSMHILQDNSRLLAEVLKQQIAIAGFTGCLRNTATGFTVTHRDDSDEIVLQHATIMHGLVMEDMQDTRSIMITGLVIKPGDRLVITDCHSVEWFTVQSIQEKNSTTMIIPTALLQNKFQKNSIVHFWQMEQWTIGNTGRVDEIGLPIKALFLRNQNGTKAAWIEGVEHLTAEYMTANSGVQITFLLRNEKMTVRREVDVAFR